MEAIVLVWLEDELRHAAFDVDFFWNRDVVPLRIVLVVRRGQLEGEDPTEHAPRRNGDAFERMVSLQ